MNDEVFEMPKMKSEYVVDNNIYDERLNKVLDLSPKRKINYFVCIFFFLLIFGTIFTFMFADIRLKSNVNYVDLNCFDVISYDSSKNIVELSIEPTSTQEDCKFINESGEEILGKIVDNKCQLNIDVEFGEVIFTNKYDINSRAIEITDYVVDVIEKDIYYLPLNKEIELSTKVIAVGNPEINWIALSENVQIIGNKLKTLKVGRTIIRAMSDNRVVHEMEVVVTDTIVQMPKQFNKKKKYLPCKEFSLEESKLLDEILEYRINEVGYGTRAAAVEAARFLTLEFPYRITYFYETGRLNTPGRAKVDGEGRYYHKGLYLHTDKYDDLAYVGNGPAIWGCGLRCYEDAPPYFKPGNKYPNGLSCSGFVTWVLYNAGFDVGDIGAGETPYPHQLTDVGKYTSLTPSLIKSGKIKVGDLFNVWGHISILVGEDSKNYYIAESLDLYGGVVINTYSKKNVRNTFPYVVLMDEVYKKDGNLTDLWY